MVLKKIDIVFIIAMSIVIVATVYLLFHPEAGKWLIVSKWDIGDAPVEMLIAVFTVTLLGNLSPFPTPYVVAIFFVGGKMNPFLVGLVASVAAVTGELASYLLGRGGRAVAKESVENVERLEKMKKLAEDHPWIAMFLVYIAALTFIPDDLILFPLGLAGFSFKKTVIPCYLGKLTMVMAVSLAGAFSLEWLLDMLEPAGMEWLSGMITIALVIVVTYIMFRIDIDNLVRKWSRH